MYQKIQYFAVKSSDSLQDILMDINSLFFLERNSAIEIGDDEMQHLLAEKEMVVSRLTQLFAYYTGLDRRM